MPHPTAAKDNRVLRIDLSSLPNVPRPPLVASAGHVPRILAYRLLGIRGTLAISTLLSRVELSRRPDRRRQIEAALESLLEGGRDRPDFDRLVRLSRAIRRLGTHTHAPIFRRSREWLLETLQAEGLEHLEAVKRAGRGAIILGTHVGLNGWVGPILTRLGYPLHLMQRRNISLSKFLLLRWEGLASQILLYPLPGEEGVHLKRMLDLLRQGRWMQHGGDNVDPKAGVCGRYLGHPVRFARAGWELCRLSGAPALVIMVLVDERRRARLVIGPPIYVSPNGPAAAALETALQQYLDFVGSLAGRQPWNISLLDWETFLESGAGS